MESYCVKHKKFTKNIALILSNIATCGSKKSIFTKNIETKRLLSGLGL